MSIEELSPSGDHSHPVVIVGSGLAGLTCAKVLHDRKIDFILIEANSSVGGRVQTETRNGYHLDKGFQVLLDSYPEARSNLDFKQLDLGYFLPGALIRYRKKFTSFSDPFRSPSQIFSTALSPVATWGDKIRLAKMSFQSIRGISMKMRQPTETSTSNHLRQLGFSERVIESFFEPFFGGVFLESKLQTTNRKFIELFNYFSRGRASLPAGGMHAIPRQLASKIPAHRLLTNKRIVKVSHSKVTIDSGEVVEGRCVILACDPWNAANLLNETPPPSGHSTTVLYFGANQSPLRAPWLVLNGDEAGPINSMCVPSDVAKHYSPERKSLISVTVKPEPAASLNSFELVDKVREQLRFWYGEQTNCWEFLDSFTITNSLPVQNSTSEARGQKGIRRVGNIIVCGDYLEVASIQGAMHSGRMAAEIAAHS